MNVSRVVGFAVISLISSYSVSAKVFRLKNSETGQVMEVSCLFPSSVQCQTKLEEAKKRLIQQTNPNRTSLSGARAEDTAKGISDSAVALGNNVRDGAVGLGNTIRDGASNVAEGGMDLASRAGDKISETYQRASEGVGNAIESAKGKTYRLKVPGIEHTMTFHCHGGLESKECLRDKTEAEIAIRSGSTAATLQDHKLRHLNRAGEVVRDVAEETATRVGDGLDRLGHNSCKAKLERHARDFDNSYRDKFVSGEQTELVSYVEKMDYIKERLVSEGRYEDCQIHFENAELGYQLEWVAGRRLERRDTNIFDGLGRHKEGMGYWTNEERRPEHSGSVTR